MQIGGACLLRTPARLARDASDPPGLSVTSALCCAQDGAPTPEWDQRECAVSRVKQNLVGKRVEEVVDAEAQALGGRNQRIAHVVDPLPEVAQVVIVVQDHAEAAVIVVVAV